MNAPAPDTATLLAIERTRVAYERTMMAWVRTGTSLITFGFTVYKFFQLDEAVKLSGRMLIGPREFAIGLILVGLLSLVLGTVEHARDLRVAARAESAAAGLAEPLGRGRDGAARRGGAGGGGDACLSARPAVRPLGDGLFTGLLRLVRLDDNSARGVRRRVVVVALLAWLPLLLLVTAQGQLLQGAAVPFVRDIEAHVRLLVVIPLLLVAEVEARNFLPTVVQEFPQRNLLPAGAMARYEAAVAAASRLRNSAWAEARADRARLCRLHGHHLAALRFAVRQHLVRGDHVRRLQADTGRLLVLSSSACRSCSSCCCAGTSGSSPGRASCGRCRASAWT